MRIRAILLLLLILALPTSVFAQEPPDISGTYSYTGTYGAETYVGTMNVTGSAPFYRQSYSDETASGESFTGDVPALGHGNALISTLGEGACSPGMLVQRSDGVLIGLWRDSFTTTNAPLGIEIYTPQGETSGFAGSYRLDGTYATGLRYAATVDIAENSGGWLDMSYSYDLDEFAPDELPFSEIGIGVVSGNRLGYAFAEEDLSTCGAWLAEFEGGNFSAVWVDEDRNVGSESGSKQ